MSAMDKMIPVGFGLLVRKLGMMATAVAAAAGAFAGHPSDDWLSVSGRKDVDFAVGESVAAKAEAEGQFFEVDSGSKATASVSGLPSGVKFDAKAWTFTGAPAKAGLYYVTMSAKNANGYKFSETVRWNVGGATSGDYDDTQLDIPEEFIMDGLKTGEPFSFAWEEGAVKSVSGLPDGLSFDSKTGVLCGIPAKPGRYAVTITDGLKRKAVYTTIVRDGGPAYLDVMAEDGYDDDEVVGGSVTGGGVYSAGQKVTLKAAPAKGYAFERWDGLPDWSCIGLPAYDARAQSLSITMPSCGNVAPVTARFVHAAEDQLDLDVGDCSMDVGEYVEMEVGVDSRSQAMVSVSGLPPGVRFDAKALKIAGAPSKAGVYYVTCSAKNANGYSRSRTVRWYAGVEGEGDFDDIGLSDAGPLDCMETGVPFEWAADGVASVSGLPPGLAFDSRAGVVSGTPSKPGKFTIMLGDSARRTARKTVIVGDSGSACIRLETGDCQQGRGTISGGGVYCYGSQVKLSAKPAKGHVFAGWYCDADMCCEADLGPAVDYRAATAVFTLEDCSPLQLYAWFVPTREDWLSLPFENGETWCLNTRDGDEWSFSVDSASLPAVTAKGLPKGVELKCEKDVFRLVVTDATKLAPGVKEVAIAAKNASGITDTRILRIAVPNITSEHLPDLDPDVNAYHVTAGISGCGICSWAEDGWTVTSISGLPKGMHSLDGLPSPLISFGGVATAPGAYTVTIEAKKKNGSEKTVATITLNVDAMPEWSYGDFTGLVSAQDEDGNEIHGYATMSVTSLGKISGKVASVAGDSWTFSSSQFDSFDGSCASATVTAKCGKKSHYFDLRITPAAAPDGLCNAIAEATAWSFGCVADGASARLLRTMWKDKAAASTAREIMSWYSGMYTASIQDDTGDESGFGYMSMSVGVDGTAKVAGKMPDGTAFSTSTPVVYEDGYKIVVHSAPKAYKGGELLAVLGINRQGDVWCESGSWTSFDPAATGDYGAGFSRDLDVSGAYYNPAMSIGVSCCGISKYMFQPEIYSPMLDCQVKFSWKDEASGRKSTETYWKVVAPAEVQIPSTYLDGKGRLPVVKATKPVQDKETKAWRYEGANDGALTLSFTPATGIFKGTYTFWYDYESAYDATTGKSTLAHTSRKVSFEGVMVQGEDVMRGFYLWDATGAYEDEKTGKEKTYKYKESHPVSLTAP